MRLIEPQNVLAGPHVWPERLPSWWGSRLPAVAVAFGGYLPGQELAGNV